MRSLLLAAASLGVAALTSACAAPVAVVAAKLGLDAGLLATTSKTSTDHLVSAAADQDCSTFRAIVGKQVCRNHEGGGDPYGVDRDAPHRAVSEDGVHTYTGEAQPTTTLNDGVFVAREAVEPTPPAETPGETGPGEVVAAGELAPPPAPAEETVVAPPARKTAAKAPPARKQQQTAKSKPPKAKPKQTTIEARRAEGAPDKG